jgi:hypothetical protein
LFRPEIIDARRQRLEGEVLLTQPVQTTTLTLLLVAIFAAINARLERVLKRHRNLKGAKAPAPFVSSIGAT